MSSLLISKRPRSSSNERPTFRLVPPSTRWFVPRALPSHVRDALTNLFNLSQGFSYEYAALGCPFDPLLSVQYYALASQNGEVEADMALSKWYLCGSQGQFDKNEGLAVTFAEKAAARQLPSAEFALGYYREVGINGFKDVEQAKMWYSKVRC